jgi:hypothetical protein
MRYGERYRSDEDNERNDMAGPDERRERQRFLEPSYAAERYDASPRRARWSYEDERSEGRSFRRGESDDDEFYRRGPASARGRAAAGGYDRPSRDRSDERRDFSRGELREDRFGEPAYDYERAFDEERFGQMTSGRGREEARYQRRQYGEAATRQYWPRPSSGSEFNQPWMIAGPHSGKGPRGYQRSKDQIIEEASQRLQQSGEIDASNIDVTCENGVLTLRGNVDDRRTKRAAEECVESVVGIDDVANELRVERRPLSGQNEPKQASSRGKTAP